MAIDASKFTIDASGNIRQVSAFVPGTHSRFSTLELHAWLQDLADNPTASGDELLSHMGFEPCGFDVLAARCGLDAAALTTALLHLEMDGQVASLAGGLFQRMAPASRAS